MAKRRGGRRKGEGVNEVKKGRKKDKRNKELRNESKGASLK